MTGEEKSARSRKSGDTLLRERGKDYFVRLAFRRWGKDVDLQPQSEKPKSSGRKKRQAGAGHEQGGE